MIFNIIKIVHILSFISWMAGLLYLPRIFVYHSDTKINNYTSLTFKIMERRLYFYICTPAAILTWITGLLMIHFINIELWLILKILLVILMSIFHLFCGKYLHTFANDKNTHTSKFFRITNEIPTVLLILIIILVILQPN